MPNPVRVQLAIQGGGAKICALIAAMEALEALQGKEIQVTRIAGTSAGAIVGTLFAAGVPMAVLKERLRGMPDSLNASFPAPGRFKAFWHVWSGDPFWKTALLESELKQLVREAGKDLQELNKQLDTLRDIATHRGIHVHVVAASLTDSGKVVYSSQDNNKNIISALLDSCAIPYCFRTWDKSGNPVVVDGGICENLPADELVDHVSKDGPVVGIAFGRTAYQSVDSFLGFSMALLNAAMDNSMDRARRRLGPDLLSLDTDIGTFDFQRACTDGLQKEYDTHRQRADKFFRSFVQSQQSPKQTTSGDYWKTENIYLMKQLGKVFEAQHASREVAYTRCSLVVTAEGLDARGMSKTPDPDIVLYKAEFSTLTDPIYCRRIYVSNSPHDTSLQRTAWKVLDIKNQREIRAIDMPMLLPDSNTTDRPLLLFFDPPLPINSGPYRFEFQDLVDNFVPFVDNRDELVFTLRNAKGPVSCFDLVLFLPKKYEGSVMVKKKGYTGRPMTEVELADYSAPVGFRPLGWRGENLSPDNAGVLEFGVDIILN